MKKYVRIQGRPGVHEYVGLGETAKKVPIVDYIETKTGRPRVAYAADASWLCGPCTGRVDSQKRPRSRCTDCAALIVG